VNVPIGRAAVVSVRRGRGNGRGRRRREEEEEEEEEVVVVVVVGEEKARRVLFRDLNIVFCAVLGAAI